MTRWRALVDLIFPQPAPALPLIVGERYVCDLSGRRQSLADLELVRTSHWVETCGEGVLQHGETAVFIGRWGKEIEVERDDVLWRRDEHPPIVAATTSLKIDLVPSRRRPTPAWRVGTVRISVPDMVTLGQLLLTDHA